ncbi:hypothetical protein NECAME_16135 [Necator americanus]|uniref:Uncharacterized protein n=1 Tax=Necator americanus TaxID=51031 RepID=W2TXJ5_NECAM|nr:hypothetical protein NECAME_16135 [Necator americanus]ETN86780.1 hypothetical protein NECAME_16135 [Necator americanus]
MSDKTSFVRKTANANFVQATIQHLSVGSTSGSGASPKTVKLYLGRGSCGTMSAPVKQPRPRFYVRSLRVTVPNYYSELAIARHHLISAQEILGKKGNETAWNITGRNRDISEAVRYLNPEPFSNMRNALKHIQSALSAPNGAKRTDSSIHTRHVTLDLIKAAHILMRAISKNSLPIAKEMKEVETILEDLQTTYFGYEHERKRAENSIEKALEKLRGKIH